MEPDSMNAFPAVNELDTSSLAASGQLSEEQFAAAQASTPADGMHAFQVPGVEHDASNVTLLCCEVSKFYSLLRAGAFQYSRIRLCLTARSRRSSYEAPIRVLLRGALPPQ